MANDTTNTPTIEEQTSVGTYLRKQLYQQTVAWGGLVGGSYLGVLAGKAFSKGVEVTTEHQQWWSELPVLSKLPLLKTAPSMKVLQWGAGVGALVGSMVSGVILGYEHWKKIKQSQLQVDELTRDISDIEVFKKTDPELKEENARLWAELKKRETEAPAKTHVERT